MAKQVKIENTSPDVGTVNVIADGNVIHALAAGQHVTVNIDEIANLSLELAYEDAEEAAGDDKVAGTVSQDAGSLKAGETVIVDRKDINESNVASGESVTVDKDDQDRKADYLSGNSPR